MPPSLSNEFFATTRWTMVQAAASGTPASTVALENLCQVYWFPLYAYIRRRGYGREDAEDLTQGFLADLLKRRDIAKAEEEKGRFRAFLLASLKHFVANEWNRARALKRGGDSPHFPLDWMSADSQFQIADVEGHSPEEIYDREWAIVLLETVIDYLREEWTSVGRADEFEHIQGFLTADDVSYADAAVALSIKEATLRVTVHRLRKRYRSLLRKEVADTLADPAMVEEELAVLLSAFR